MTSKGGYSKEVLSDIFDEYVHAALADMYTEQGLRYYQLGAMLDRTTEDKMVADVKRFLDMAWPHIVAIIAHPSAGVRGQRGGTHGLGTVFFDMRNGVAFSRQAPKGLKRHGVALTRIARTFGPGHLRRGRTGRISWQEGK